MTAFVTAILVTRQTADGLVEFEDHVELGTEYVVDLDSRRTITLVNVDRHLTHTKDVVDTACGRWLPMECLQLRVN